MNCHLARTAHVKQDEATELPTDGHEADASVALCAGLRAASQLTALLAERLEAGDDEANPTRFDRRCRQLSHQVLAPLGASDDPDATDPTREVAAGIARLVHRAQGMIAGRSEEEERLHDWLDLLQDALLPALYGTGGRPAGTKPEHDRGAPARHLRLHR